MMSDETRQRELKPLESIPDNYEKFYQWIVTLYNPMMASARSSSKSCHIKHSLMSFWKESVPTMGYLRFSVIASLRFPVIPTTRCRIFNRKQGNC